MTSTGGNPDKRLELIQKTYLHNTNSNIENSPPDRPLVAKVSNHQPSRKTSVHDVHEANNDQFNKVIIFLIFEINYYYYYLIFR